MIAGLIYEKSRQRVATTAGARHRLPRHDLGVDAALALHTAARRYLLNRRDQWIAEYSTLPNQGRRGAGYSNSALNIFPRYNVLAAIRVEVERLDADRLPVLGEVADFLASAAADSQDMLTEGEHGAIERDAMNDERERFAAWVAQAREEPPEVRALPYRRTLGAEESRRWREAMAARWPLDHGGWWQPILDKAQTDEALALADGPFWKGEGPGPATQAVRSTLRTLGLERVIELREYGPEYEIAVEWLMPTYNGAEGFFTAGQCEWLIYASHESVTALGGSVVAPFKAAWPEWREAHWASV